MTFIPSFLRSRRVFSALQLLLILAASDLAVAQSDSPSLVVNLARRTLTVFEDGRKAKNYRIAIGDDPAKTPTGVMDIETMVWNPWWYPPKDSDWAKEYKAMPPGPSNPMGAVKMNLKGRYFLHGTNAGKNVRLPATHGCVRLSNSNVRQLGMWLQEKTEPGFDKKSFHKKVSAKGSENVTVTLRKPVSVKIVPDWVSLADGAVFVAAEAGDVQKKFALVRKALLKSGHAKDRIDEGKILAQLMAAAGKDARLAVNAILK